MSEIEKRLGALGITCEDIRCDDGWAALVGGLMADVYDALGGPPYVRCIKEKFGGLRVHMDSDCLADEETNDWIYGRIRQAETESLQTCEKCGSNVSASLRRLCGGTLLKTLCEACFTE